MVRIGDVAAFAFVDANKWQALKVLEEASEAVEATKRWLAMRDTDDGELRPFVIDECADVIQATVNLLAALGVEDMGPAMAECRARNEARGRAYR